MKQSDIDAAKSVAEAMYSNVPLLASREVAMLAALIVVRGLGQYLGANDRAFAHLHSSAAARRIGTPFQNALDELGVQLTREGKLVPADE